MTADEYAKLIPPEAVEAAAREAWDSRHKDTILWDDLPEYNKEWDRDTYRAACAAMLTNWPDSILTPAELILPLPERKTK